MIAMKTSLQRMRLSYFVGSTFDPWMRWFWFWWPRSRQHFNLWSPDVHLNHSDCRTLSSLLRSLCRSWTPQTLRKRCPWNLSDNKKSQIQIQHVSSSWDFAFWIRQGLNSHIYFWSLFCKIRKSPKQTNIRRCIIFERYKSIYSIKR